jgi:DNA-binding transcriptional LysR family regulator
MQLRQLAYFVRIVEIGSFSRAAQSLHVAQPGLSQQISQLEDELGVKLLTRSVRGIAPTAAGDAVFRHAQGILKQVDATQLIAAEADSGPAGKVTVGLPWTVASLLGLPLLLEVRATLKTVRLEIVEGPSAVLANLLAEGKIEVAVLFDNAVSGGLIMRPILSEPLFFVGPRHSLAGRSNVQVQDAAAFPLLLMSRPNGIRELIEQQFSRLSLRPEVVAEINAPALLLDAVKAGLGYTILPACGFGAAAALNQVDAVEMEGGSLRRSAFLCTSRLFSISPASDRVYDIIWRLMEAAVAERRWTATLETRSEEPY